MQHTPTTYRCCCTLKFSPKMKFNCNYSYNNSNWRKNNVHISPVNALKVNVQQKRPLAPSTPQRKSGTIKRESIHVPRGENMRCYAFSPIYVATKPSQQRYVCSIAVALRGFICAIVCQCILPIAFVYDYCPFSCCLFNR